MLTSILFTIACFFAGSIIGIVIGYHYGKDNGKMNAYFEMIGSISQKSIEESKKTSKSIDELALLLAPKEDKTTTKPN